MRALFTLTVFLSSFLLFLVQPLVGKMVLPTFGGAPPVWTASLVFFQTPLLLGYAYAHVSAAHLSLCALLAYPFLLEPRFRLADQSWSWACGYAALCVLVLACG